MADPPRNRRERRAEAKKSGKPFEPLTTAADIPMAVPDFSSRPKGRTLMDIADERTRDLLKHGQPFSPQHGDGLVRDEQGRVLLPESSEDDNDDEDAPIGPLGEALFLTITLAVLHFTLNLLVHNQYGAAPPTLAPLVRMSAKEAPWLFFPVYALKHPRLVGGRWGARVKQILHLVIGTGAGCYMLWIGNRESYLDVMARAPSIGMVWIWSVVEMGLVWAVSSLAICGGFVLWHGLSLM